MAGPARAQSAKAEADALFDTGKRLYTDGKIAEACDAFEASNRADPRAGTLIQLGGCREQNGQIASAHAAFQAAAARATTPSKRAYAASQVVALEARLSYLTVSVPMQSRTPDLVVTRNGAVLDPALWDHPQAIDGGDYVIASHAPGRHDWQVTVHVPRERGTIVVAVPQPVLHASPSDASSEASSPTALSPGSNQGASNPGWSTRRKASLAFAGTSVASAVTGAVFGWLSWSHDSDAAQLCPVRTLACSDAQGNRLAAASHSVELSRRDAVKADIAFGVAGAAAIAAGYLWFTGDPDEREPRLRIVPDATPHSSAVLVMGSF